jgi:hypothetical protein
MATRGRDGDSGTVVVANETMGNASEKGSFASFAN